MGPQHTAGDTGICHNLNAFSTESNIISCVWGEVGGKGPSRGDYTAFWDLSAPFLGTSQGHFTAG